MWKAATGIWVRLLSVGFVGGRCVVPSLVEERHSDMWTMKSSICLPGTCRAVGISSGQVAFPQGSLHLFLPFLGC